MIRKTSLHLLMVIVVTLGFVQTAYAQSPSTTPHPQPYSIDPNYKPTQEEIDRLAAKEKAAKDYLDKKNNSNKSQGISPMSGTAKTLWVGNAEQFREPPDGAYVNYCAPSSTQVVLRARTTNIPALETIATKENVDPNWGTTMPFVTTALNFYLGATWYSTIQATGANDLQDKYVFDIDMGWAMTTALQTAGMPGWDHNADHIVSIYGYNTLNGNSQAYYVDTASDTAGHKYYLGGSYFNTANLSNFWVWVFKDDTQSW